MTAIIFNWILSLQQWRCKQREEEWRVCLQSVGAGSASYRVVVLVLAHLTKPMWRPTTVSLIGKMNKMIDACFLKENREQKGKSYIPDNTVLGKK